MAGINKKIMAFVGTEETAELVSELAEHTENIYAAVSDEYGKASHPTGNITLISRTLDEEKMNSWMDRVGVDIVIDGTALTAYDARKLIQKVCKERSVEYLRIAAELQTNVAAAIFRSDEPLIRELEYTVGGVLVEGSPELLKTLTKVKGFQDKLFPVIPAEAAAFAEAAAMGYRRENLLGFNRMLHSDFLRALFEELKISNYVFEGKLLEGMQERLDAVDHSDVKAAVYGDFSRDEGMSAAAVMDLLTARFRLGD